MRRTRKTGITQENVPKSMDKVFLNEGKTIQTVPLTRRVLAKC